jgi:DNA-binding CsgD family transcriptional regulator
MQPKQPAQAMTADTLRSLEQARAARVRLGEQGRWAEAEEIVRGAIDLAVLGEVSVKGPVLAGLVYVVGGPRQGITICDKMPSVPAERRTAMQSMLLANRGRDRRAMVESCEGVLSSLGVNDPGTFSYATLALAYAGEIESARAHCEQAIASPGWGRTDRHRDALDVLRARLAGLAGEPLVARRRFTEMLERGVYPQFLGLVVAWTVATLVQLGELTEANDLLHDHDFGGGLEDIPDRAELLAARGALHLASGRSQLASDDFLACGRELGGWAVTNPAVTPWRSQAALAAHAARRPALAAILAQEELAEARRWGSERAIGIALHAFALVCDDGDRARSLAEAAELLRRGGAKTELIRVQYDLGVVLNARKQHDAGRAAFETAREIAVQTGNAQWVRQVDEALHRSDHVSTARSLTPRELEVATLARANYTNKQIAEQLNLAPHTVKTHLSVAYRKLGVSGRSDLGASFLPPS